MKKLQNGRSMIEMLGVLAIIGVLSIGGLAGYTMAMNRHKANTIIDLASKCAVMIQTQGMGDDEISSQDCFEERYLGAKSLPGYDLFDGSDGANKATCLIAKRVKQGDTTVTVTFTGDGNQKGIASALAARAGVAINANGKYTYTAGGNKWCSGETCS